MPTLRLLSLLILAPVLLLTCASAEQEKEPEYPPIQSLDDVTDITDKVLAWDVPVGTIEEFSIFDTIPPLPNPDPICFAPEGLDSFADGRKIPRQFGIEPDASPVERRIDPWKRTPGADLPYNPVEARYWEYIKLLKRPVIFGKDNRFSTAELSDAYMDMKIKQFRNYSNETFLNLNHIRWVQFSDGRYGMGIVNSILDLKFSETGEVTEIASLALKGAEFLAYANYQRSSPEPGFTVFLKDGSTLITLLHDGTTKEVPFNFTPTYKHNIWNAAAFFHVNNFLMGTEPRSFPLLSFVERNYGMPRDTPHQPPMYTPGWGHNPAFDEYYPKYTVVSDQPQSRTVLIDISSGKIVQDAEAVSTLWVLDGKTWMYPRVAKDGKWCYAVFDAGGRNNYIPSSALIPFDAYDTISTQRCCAIISLQSSTILDFVGKRVRRVLHERPHDKQMFHSYLRPEVRVSQPFIYEGKQARHVWVYSVWEEQFKFSFIIEDVFVGSELPCGIVPFGTSSFLVFTGEAFCVVNRKAEKEDK